VLGMTDDVIKTFFKDMKQFVAKYVERISLECVFAQLFLLSKFDADFSERSNNVMLVDV